MALTYTIDAQKIPEAWVRSFLQTESLEDAGRVMSDHFDMPDFEQRLAVSGVVDYLAGVISLDDYLESLGELSSCEGNPGRTHAIVYYLLHYYAYSVGSETPRGDDFYADFDAFAEKAKSFESDIAALKGFLDGNTNNETDDSNVQMPIVSIADDFAPDSLAMVSEIIDPAHELMPPVPMVVADTKLGIRNAEFGIIGETDVFKNEGLKFKQTTPSPSLAKEGNETPARIVKEAIHDLHEAAAHQIYAVQVDVPDYAALAKAAVDAALGRDVGRPYVSAGENKDDAAAQMDKITALAERRLRGLGEAYDFRARAAAWAETNGIDARGAASLVAAVEMAFMKLHAAGKGVLQYAPAIMPVETYDLEKSIAEKMSAEVGNDKKTDVAVDAGTDAGRGTAQYASASAPVPMVKNETPVSQADPSRAFVDALAQSKPVAVLPNADAAGSDRVSDGGTPLSDKGHEIPYVARIPTWQDKLKRDVTPVARALLTPIDEIRTMTVSQWRRLGATPEKCAERLREKALAIASEAADKRVEAVKAWRQTEMYRQYVAVGAELMRGGTDVPKAIAALKVSLPKGEEYITPDEWKSILDLNSALRFS